MLPGFRFLLAAILLSMSVLIFGLGAAALLRAAHEEVASVPTRRVMPEMVFAQPTEPASLAPSLALLRVEPAEPEREAAPAQAAPEPAPEAVPVPKVETEQLAALRLDETTQAEPAKPAAVTIEPATPQAAADQPPPAELAVAAAAALPEPVAPPSAAAAPAPAPSEPVASPAMTEPEMASTKTAALGNPTVTVERPETKKAEQPGRREIRKQQRAERARERRRQAARRARLAAQQATVAQPTTDLLSQSEQPAPQARPAARRR